MNSLALTGQARWFLENFCDREHPKEVGGILLGRTDVSGNFVVEDIFPIANHSETPNGQYIQAPGWDTVANFYARSRNLEVLGLFHSHPNGTIPSEQDMKAYDGKLGLWVIHHSVGKHSFAAARSLIHLPVQILSDVPLPVRSPVLMQDRANLGDMTIDQSGRLRASQLSLTLIQASEKARVAYLAIVNYCSYQGRQRFNTKAVAGYLSISQATMALRLKELDKLGLIKREYGGGWLAETNTMKYVDRNL